MCELINQMDESIEADRVSKYICQMVVDGQFGSIEPSIGFCDSNRRCHSFGYTIRHTVHVGGSNRADGDGKEKSHYLKSC